MQAGKIRNLYPGGNTAEGFYSLYASVLENLERLLILKGGPGTGKSTLIRLVGLTMVDRGYDVEYLHCSSDNCALDGVIIPALSLGIVDGTTPHVIEPQFPGAVDEIINLGECWNTAHLQAHRKEIISLTTEIRERFQAAYASLRKAREQEKKWEVLVGEAMDFRRVDDLTTRLTQEIFPFSPKVRHVFAGAITPEGAVYFMENLTADCTQRFILYGAPGSGKSTVIHKIAEAAINQGYQVELFPCAYDPRSVDMVLIPELKIAVLDGSPPHFIEAQRPGDQGFNLMEYADAQVLAGNKSACEAKALAFNQALQEAIEKIAQAKGLHDTLEGFYVEAMDFAKLDTVRDRVLEEVLQRINAYEQTNE